MKTTAQAMNQGACFCAAFTFRARGEPIAVSYCHCNDCRRATGAPVTVFVGYDEARVEFERGEPKIHQSSPGVRRAFCARCGTPLFYVDERLSGELYFTVGVFNNPEGFPPQRHAWVTRQLPWLRVADDLPRHEGNSRPRDNRGTT